MSLVVAITVLLGGLPAVAMVALQLQRQVESRISSRQAATRGLLQSEKTSLLQLAQLVAERPTLCNLLADGDVTEIGPYLDAVRKNAPADLLAVVSSAGIEASSGPVQLSRGSLPALPQVRVVDLVVLDELPAIALYAGAPIPAMERCTNPGHATVLAVRLLDNDFMRTLARDTGLEQSLILDQSRIASSLARASTAPRTAVATDQATHRGDSCCSLGKIDGGTYYTGSAPMLDRHGSVLALSEVALPAEAIRNSVYGTVALLLGIGLLVMLGGMVLTVLLTRSITRPLGLLAEAAERMGAGDLATPIPVASGWLTIDRLAGQLDHTRRELWESQELARKGMSRVVRLLSAIPEGVVTISADGMLTWINADACAMLGHDRNELLGRHYSEVFRPVAGETASAQQVLWPAAGEPILDRLTVLHSTGRPITLSVLVSPIETGSSDLLERRRDLLVILRDVSEEHAAGRLRSDFMANLAHEFRTPLTAISASAELLADSPRELSPDELGELAGTIRLSSVHLQALVDNLLESAIIEAGVYKLRWRAVHLPEMLGQAAEMIAPILHRRQQRLLLNNPTDQQTVRADADRLRQALLNLLQNASKFGPTASTIELSVQAEKGALRFAVSDSGPGLPAERFADLFNRFVTSKRTGGAQYGIGLGLSIVKAVAEAHGGSVGAENRPGGGARVWFEIPLRPPDTEGVPDDPDPGRR